MAVLGALGDLVLSLSADTARFQSDLGRADRLSKKFSREVGAAMGRLMGMVVALAGAAGFGALVKGQIDAADAAGKLAEQLGITVEELSALQVQAKLADVSQQQLGVGLGMLAKNQADFVAGTGEARTAFQALGITVGDIEALGGDTAKLFDLIAGKMSKMADGGNKTAIAMKIFGESGKQMIPLINRIEETRKEAAELNAIIDKPTAQAAERFNDNLTRMGIAVQAIGLNIARAVLPTLEDLSEGMVQTAKDAGQFDTAGKIANAGLKLLGTAATLAHTTFKTLGQTIGGVAAMVVAFAEGDYRRAGKIFAQVLMDNEADLKGAGKRIGDLWDDAAKNVKGKAPQTGRDLAAPALEAANATEKATAATRAAIMRVHDDAVAAMEADIEIQKRQQEEITRLAELRENAGFEWATESERQAHLQHELYLKTVQVSEGVRIAEKATAAFSFTFDSAIENAILQGEKFSNVLRAIGQDIARMAIRTFVTNPLGNAFAAAAGQMFAPGSTTGDVTSEAAALGIQQFAQGTDFVPRNMIAMVHKGEKIIPAGESGGNVFAPTINIGAGNAVTRQEVNAALRESERRVIAVQAEMKRR